MRGRVVVVVVEDAVAPGLGPAVLGEGALEGRRRIGRVRRDRARRTISGSRLFGTLPSSLKMKVSVPSGALYCPGRPYAAARAIAASVQQDSEG